jgi:mycofactocin precursor
VPTNHLAIYELDTDDPQGTLTAVRRTSRRPSDPTSTRCLHQAEIPWLSKVASAGSRSDVSDMNTERNAPEREEPVVEGETLVEEVSIDGMCGVY